MNLINIPAAIVALVIGTIIGVIVAYTLVPNGFSPSEPAYIGAITGAIAGYGSNVIVRDIPIIS